jgi:hypothetical protein
MPQKYFCTSQASINSTLDIAGKIPSVLLALEYGLLCRLLPFHSESCSEAGSGGSERLELTVKKMALPFCPAKFHINPVWVEIGMFCCKEGISG